MKLLLPPGVPAADSTWLLVQVTAWPLAVQLQLPLVRVPVQFGTIPSGNWSRTVMTPAGTFGGLPVGTAVVLLIVSVYWVPAWP
ncbi:hypothetical protein D3C81_992410 [compost metagenome]